MRKGEIEKAYAHITEGQLHLRRRSVESDCLPLVALHASPASSASLSGLMEAVEGRTVLAFDNPCNGQSCAPLGDAPKIIDFADMLNRGCDALGEEKIALYGTHTGAHIAIAWALAHPERVQALILDGVALLDDDLRTEMLEHYAHPRQPDETGSQFHWAWQYMRDQMIFFPHYKKDAEHMRAGGSFDPELLHTLTMDILANLESYHLPYHAVFSHDVRQDLTKLAVPTLLIGDEGNPLDAGFAELQSLVPGAQVVLCDESPASKAAAIATFLEKVLL